MAIEPLVLTRGRPRTADLIQRIRELETEAAAYAHEERGFVQLVSTSTGRLLRMIEGGLLVEAHRTAASVAYAADRRARQLAADPESAA